MSAHTNLGDHCKKKNTTRKHSTKRKRV